MPRIIDVEHYCAHVCRNNESKCDKSSCPIWNAPVLDADKLAQGPHKKPRMPREELLKSIGHCLTFKKCEDCPVIPKDAKKGSLGCLHELMDYCRDYIESQKEREEWLVYVGISGMMSKQKKIEELEKLLQKKEGVSNHEL